MQKEAAKSRALALLSELYGTSPDFMSWWAHFANQIEALQVARSAELKQLDAHRLAQADWFLSEKMLGYCAYTDRFAGSIKGIQERIPHLKNLGVSYLHLLPFYLARAGGPDENDGGFAIADFEKLDPKLGHIDELDGLCQALRKNGISLCADFVLNHVADSHPWAMAAKSGDSHYLNFFRSFPDRNLPDQFEQTVGQVFPETAPGNFTFNLETKRWFWTTFYPFQWDLNYENKEVFAAVVSTLLRLANRGVEVFRLDSAPFLWKQLGTTCLNLPQAHTLLCAIRAVCAWAAPAVVLKSEAIVPAAQAAAYLGSESQAECQIAYHGALMAAGWAALAEQKVDLLQAVISATAAAPANTSWLTYVRCHDDIVWSTLKPEVLGLGDDYQTRIGQVSRFFAGQVPGSFAQGLSFQTGGDTNAVHGTNGMCAALVGLSQNAAYAQERMLLLYALAATHGGMPVIYMGDEWGQGNDPLGYGMKDSRWVHRPYFEGDAAVPPANTSIFTQLKTLFAERARNPDFAASAKLTLLDSGSPAVLLFQRGQHTLCAFNFNEQTQSVKGQAALAPWSYRLSSIN